ncbi:arginine--tRNA ligase [bacterium]|nr:arginine--tRNA ligase [bacterium]MBU1983330.1 arginine--tRNA ligase [bacterium]
MNRVHEHLGVALKEALQAMNVESPRVILEKPRDPSHGDVATNAAMTYAKTLRQPPRAVAERILERLRLDNELVAQTSIAGPGFINFAFAPEYLRSIATQALERGDAFGDDETLTGTRILIEFVSANPSGPLNVVSARAAAVGDSLVHMFRARGAQCDAEFYVNDAGNQVRLLGESVRARYETELGNPTEIPEGGYHGEYLIELARRLVAQHGDRYRRMTDDAAEQLGAEAVRSFVDSHRESLRSFRVEFDKWFFESELRGERGELRILEELRRRNTVYEKEGATYLRTEEYGDVQDWVIVTSDGRATYFLPDIAYHVNKYDRGYDHVLNILGPDHHTFASRMKAAMRALGRDADRLEVILLQHVTLLRDGQPVKMSKRAGQIIEMDELITEVGADAARYFFILRRTSTPLDFDIELAKRQTEENPVFYVQYAHARIESIFRKAGVSYPDPNTDLTPLVRTEELDLLRRLRELRDMLDETTGSRDPHGITVWLRNVATQFHKFYHECRVLTTPPELQAARLALCRATQIALQKGLTLCGVSAPREM